MNTLSVLNMLGRFLAMFTVPMLLCSVWAFSNDRYPQASLFILVVTLTFVIAAVLLVSTAKIEKAKSGLRETVAFLLAAWLSVSVIGAFPFLLVTKGDFISALFESVSCATTTGTSLLVSDSPLSASLVAWRGVLHLIGAMLSISGTLMLISLINPTGQGTQTMRPVGMGFSLQFSSFIRVFLMTGLVVAALISVSMMVLTAEGISLRTSFVLGVGAATTGQVMPFADNTLTGTIFSVPILCLVLLVASVSMGTLLALFRDWRRANVDPESFGVLLLMLFLAICLLLFSGEKQPLIAFGESASIISTSGLMLTNARFDVIGLPIIIFFGFVGGSAISSTGGMKVFRMRLLLARTGYEFSRLAQPHAVMNFKFAGVQRPLETMISVWVYLIGFAVVAVSLAGYLALDGNDFAESISIAVGAITNSAALFRPEMLMSHPGPVSQLILTFSMIFGRLELLLLLSFVFKS